MNNSKIWLVVKPTVGVPMFLGAVAVGSFAVHVAVLSNTSWVSDFLSGKELGSQTAAIQAPVQPASLTVDGAKVFAPTNASLRTNTEEMTVVLPDGRQAKAVFEKPLTVVSADPPKSQ